MSRTTANQGTVRAWREAGRWVVELELPSWILVDLADELARDQTGLIVGGDPIDIAHPLAHVLLVQASKRPQGLLTTSSDSISVVADRD